MSGHLELNRVHIQNRDRKPRHTRGADSVRSAPRTVSRRSATTRPTRPRAAGRRMETGTKLRHPRTSHGFDHTRIQCRPGMDWTPRPQHFAPHERSARCNTHGDVQVTCPENFSPGRFGGRVIAPLSIEIWIIGFAGALIIAPCRERPPTLIPGCSRGASSALMSRPTRTTHPVAAFMAGGRFVRSCGEQHDDSISTGGNSTNCNCIRSMHFRPPFVILCTAALRPASIHRQSPGTVRGSA